MMKIGCGTVCFRNLPLEDALRRIARAGYHWVETQATAPFCPHVDPWHDDPEAFKSLVADYGFEGVTALWAPHGAILADPEAVAGVSAALQWAQAAGIPVVNAGDGQKPKDMSEADALALLGERLAAILEVAQRCQVFVAIEPHGTFSLTPTGLEAIMGLSESPWLGINYDTANVHRATYVETAAGAYNWQPVGESADEVATLERVVSHVVHCHVKDTIGARSVALGEGEVDVLGCLQVLDRHGYDGVVSLETEGDEGPDEMEQMIERSRRYLEEALRPT
ncbi:MAG: sugar phosphate isomerase/epimerase family protein [Armatimonadia bacterium]